MRRFSRLGAVEVLVVVVVSSMEGGGETCRR